jgi:sec-independent protein translocase protein TatB
MASDFQGQFSEALREAELSQIKDELQNLKQKASVEDAFSHVADMLETKVDAPAATEAARTEGRAEEAASPELAPAPAAVPMPQPAPLPEPLPLPEPETSKPGPGSAP